MAPFLRFVVGMSVLVSTASPLRAFEDLIEGQQPLGFLNEFSLKQFVAEILGVEVRDERGRAFHGRYSTSTLGGGLGNWSYSGRIDFELSREQWAQFEDDIYERIRDRLFDRGSAERVGGSRSRGSHAFNQSASFDYVLKGDEGKGDLAGRIHLHCVDLGTGRVSVVVSVHEFEIDFVGRLREAISAGGPNKQAYIEALERWEQQPTAAELRARRADGPG